MEGLVVKFPFWVALRALLFHPAELPGCRRGYGPTSGLHTKHDPLGLAASRPLGGAHNNLLHCLGMEVCPAGSCAVGVPPMDELAALCIWWPPDWQQMPRPGAPNSAGPHRVIAGAEQVCLGQGDNAVLCQYERARLSTFFRDSPCSSNLQVRRGTLSQTGDASGRDCELVSGDKHVVGRSKPRRKSSATPRTRARSPWAQRKASLVFCHIEVRHLWVQEALRGRTCSIATSSRDLESRGFGHKRA